MPRYWDSIDPRLWPEQESRARGVVQQYSRNNKKLFPRELLEQISEVLTDYRNGRYGKEVPVLEVPDYVDGDTRLYRIKLNLGLDCDKLTKLNYYPIQRLMNPYWYEPSKRTGPIPRTLNPSEVKSYSYDICDKERIQHFEETWTSNYHDWLEGPMPAPQDEGEGEEEEEDTRKTLLKGLAKIPAANFKGINKVIALELAHHGDHIQAGIPMTASKDSRIEFGNMPLSKIYGTMCRDSMMKDSPVLQYMELHRLEDPLGYLTVDDHTLVCNVYARTPVMQILADAVKTPPAMILWRHIVEYDADDYAADRDKHLKWDPISPRAHNLLQKYRPYGFEKTPSFLYDPHTRLYVIEKP